MTCRMMSSLHVALTISTENNLNKKKTAEEDKTVTWADVVKGKQVCIRS